MSEEKDDVRTDITTRTSVKFPIGLIAGIVVGAAAAGWSQFEAHKQYDDERFNELYRDINKKASDRYTGTQARQFEESVKQRFIDVEKTSVSERKGLQIQLNECMREIKRLEAR